MAEMTREEFLKFREIILKKPGTNDQEELEFMSAFIPQELYVISLQLSDLSKRLEFFTEASLRVIRHYVKEPVEKQAPYGCSPEEA